MGLLSGDSFVRGIVSTTGEEDAVRWVFGEIGNHREAWGDEGQEPPCIVAARVSARMIGIAVDVTPHALFAMGYGSDGGVG